MRILPASPRPRPWRTRSVALLLLVLQGLIAATPFVERRSVSDLPRIHVEQKDAPHLDLHNDDTCALCSVRAEFATPPGAVCPLVETGRPQLVSAGDVDASRSTDARVGNLSRAPPPLTA